MLSEGVLEFASICLLTLRDRVFSHQPSTLSPDHRVSRRQVTKGSRHLDTRGLDNPESKPDFRAVERNEMTVKNLPSREGPASSKRIWWKAFDLTNSYVDIGRDGREVSRGRRLMEGTAWEKLLHGVELIRSRSDGRQWPVGSHGPRGWSAHGRVDQVQIGVLLSSRD